MRLRVRRGVLVPAAVVAGAALIALMALHTPWARDRALQWVANFVTGYDLALHADGLQYNLLTRRITLTGVRLAATGYEERPFLTAARIEVSLPWMVYRGRFQVDQLDITQARVDIYRDLNDVANLPRSSDGPPLETPRRLVLHGFAVHGLDLQYEDASRDWSLVMPGIDTDLRTAAIGAAGELSIGGHTAVRIGERTLTLAPITSGMSFNGSDVSLEAARLVAPELDATLSGPIRRVLDTTALDLTLKGVVDLDPAGKWVPPPPVPVGGIVTIDGTVIGPLGGSVVQLAVSSDDLSIGRETGVALAGPVIVTSDATFGEGLILTPRSGGEIRAAFNVPWGDTPPSTARATWNGVDGQAALSLGDFDALPIGAAFAGSGTFAFGDVPRYVVTNTATPRTRARLVPVTGTLDAEFVGDDYTVRHAHRVEGMDVEGDTAGRMDREDLPRTTLAGPLRVHVLDVAAAARSLETLGIEMPAIAHEIRGALDGDMVLSGSFGDPSIDGPVNGDAVNVPLIGVVRASARVSSTAREATMADIDVRRGSAVLRGTAVANLTADAWSGALEFEAPDGIDVQDAVPEAWRIRGPITATGTLGGTLDVVELDTTMTGGAFTWADQNFDAFTAELVATPVDVDVTALHVTQGDGALDGRVRYAYDTGAYRAALKGHTLAWNGTVLSPNDTRAGFSMEFEGEGTIEQPFGHGRIDFALVGGGAAGALIETGSVTLDLQGDLAHLVAQLPALGATVTGEVSTAAPYAYQGTADLDHLDAARLATLVSAIEGEVMGFVSGTTTASGSLADPSRDEATVDLQTVDVALGGVPIALNAPIRVSLNRDGAQIENLDMQLGAGRLTASGAWTSMQDGRGRGTFDGQFQDVLRMARAAGLPAFVDGTGSLTVHVETSGTRAGTTATLAIAGGTFNWGFGPAAIHNLNVQAALKGEDFTLSRLSGDVAIGGVVGAFAAHADARVPSFSVAALDGELIIDEARFTFSGLPVVQQRPSTFRFADGAIAATDVEWSVANNAIRVSGSVGVAEPDPPLDLSIQGLVDLRVLSAFSRSVAFDGTAELDVRVGGQVSTPALGGQVVLSGADVALSEPRLVLSELSGPITLSGQTVLLEDIRGFANGGAVAFDGVLRIEDLAVAGGVVNIQAQAVALELAKGLRSELDALIIFRPDPTAPSLTGDVRVVQSSYTDTITIASLARRAAAPVAPLVDRPYLDRLRLNLAVTTTDDTTVDNNYGRLEASTDLRIVGTVAEPGANGRITLKEGGELFLAGRTFRITRGDISFSDLRRIRPQFNIVAEAAVGSEEVTMTLSGTLDRPQLDLTSEAGSKTPGELAASIVGTNNTETALTLLSADLLGVTGRSIGLDTFRVERGEYVDRDFQEDPALYGDTGDPTTRLTLAKRLSEQVEVTLSQNLRESGKTTVVVNYLPGRNVEVRAVSRDNATISVGVRHEITVGGGTSRRAAVRVRPVVSAITFQGVDAEVEAEARRHLRLKPGDEFDFLTLQRDTDRLRDAFHEQGRLEARIRTRRVENEAANTLALEYRIERGPRTTLEITCVTLPASERAALADAWGRNTFDQFLIEDLTDRVRRYLVTQNELASVVVGTTSRPADDRKVLRIDVTPGAPVTGREIRFTGNASVRRGVLDDVVSVAGVELEAWIARTVVEREVLGLYRGLGYLKVQVDAGPLEIDGTTGVLPVAIVEGPRATVSSLTWPGVADERLEAVRKAAAFAPRQPFVGDEINEARRRVERLYRGLGFNAVDVRVEPQFGEDDNVALAFEVAEGPQQVLTEVTTAGTNRTRGHVIREALRFELGKPVDLDEWARARKRLYDTNVFRQVDIQTVPVGTVVDGVQAVRADVTVTEYPPWSFRYGAQLESERRADFGELTTTRNLGAVAEVKNPNLFGRALTAGLFGRYELRRQNATVLLATSRLFGWPARSSLYGYASRDRINDTGDVLAAITDRQGVSVDQRWRAGGLQIVYGYRFERSRTFDPDPAVSDPFPLDFIANLARMSGAVLFDRRDDPLNARRGTFSSISWDHSALWLGSDVSNQKLLMQQYLFIPLGPRLVFASRIQSGFVFGLDGLLASDRFVAGGATTVRGYRQDSLGPRDSFGVPNGGETLVVLNQEIRFPIYRWIQGVGFIDAGNITRRGDSAWKELKVGYGLGLRFDTPAGLMRIDFGMPRSRTGSTTGRWYFGFGHIF